MKKLDLEDLAQRRGQILDCAHDFLVEKDLAELTMAALASRLPFSRGTLYNCFASREDVVVALLARKTGQCLELFRRAAAFQGKPRERFFAISIAADIDSREDLLRSQFLADQEILAAASPAWREDFLSRHEAIIRLIVGIVDDAIREGHLPADTDALRVTNAAWSLYVGSDELKFRGFIYRDLGRRRFEEQRLPMFNALLDGFGWQPYADQIDFAALRTRILSEIFAAESARHGLAL